MNKKASKPSKMATKRKQNYSGSILDIEVLQHGAVQASSQWVVGLIRKKIVTFGASNHADMPVPFSTLPPKVEIFEISKEGINVKIDPRTDGFINRGQEFSDVRELLAPRGALAEVASIEDPLHLWLEPGSRGALRIYGYEIIFKYKKPEKKKKKLVVAGEAKVIFAPMSSDGETESHAFWFAFCCVAIMIVPMTIWLLKMPATKYTTLLTLPRKTLTKIINPKNYPFLPSFFGPAFNPANAQTQTVFLMTELRKRWNANAKGETYLSNLQLLQNPMPLKTNYETLHDWTEKVNSEYQRLEKFKQDPYSPRYYQFQVDYPRLSTTISGGEMGSIRENITGKINKLYKTYQSVYSLVELEHSSLQKFYEGILKFNKPPGSNAIIMPEVVFVGNKANPEFEVESNNYLYAQNIAYHSTAMVGENDKTPTLWLSQDNLIFPDTKGLVAPLAAAVEHNIVQNTQYSIAEKPLPPPVPPKPQISQGAVEKVIFDHREELKSCYDSLLRRAGEKEGTVNIRWKITPTGRSEDPKIAASDFKDRDFHFCLRARIMNWQLPKPTNGAVMFEYPFKFLLKAR